MVRVIENDNKNRPIFFRSKESAEAYIEEKKYYEMIDSLRPVEDKLRVNVLTGKPLPMTKFELIN